MITDATPGLSPALALAPTTAQGVALTSQPPVRLIVVNEPLPDLDLLALGLAVVVCYLTENLRLVPVFGSAALTVSPRIGHLHITLDDATWHWVVASRGPLIITGLPPGQHKLLVELAGPIQKPMYSATINFEVPPSPSCFK